MRWVGLGVLVLVAGCFADPPATESSGSTSDASSSGSVTSGPQTTSPVSTSGSSSSGDGTTSSTSSTSSSTAADTSTGEPDPACEDGMVCTPAAPPDWEGPVLVTVVEGKGPAPQCPKNTQEQWRGGAEPTAMCDCSTCSPTGPLCSVDVLWGENGFCDSGEVAGVGCLDFEGGAAIAQLALSVVTGEGTGVCAVPEAPQAHFEQRAVVCGPPQLEACEDGVCVREMGPRCIWAQDDRPCPPGYSDRSVLYESIEAPDLECDACSCGVSEFSCEAVEIDAYAAPACGGEQQGNTLTLSEGECSAFFGGTVLVSDVESLDVRPLSSCDSPFATAVPTGEILPAGPRTVCCAEP